MRVEVRAEVWAEVSRSGGRKCVWEVRLEVGGEKWRPEVSEAGSVGGTVGPSLDGSEGRSGHKKWSPEVRAGIVGCSENGSEAGSGAGKWRPEVRMEVEGGSE